MHYPSMPAPLSLVLFAKDKDRVSRFYAATLGLPLEASEPSHDRLADRQSEIIVHAIPAHIAADIEISRPATPRASAAFKPVFFVTDLASTRRAAEQTGGSLAPEESAWLFRGHRVLDGHDPEGNVVQFRQPVPTAD